jgi:hypothetical protein
LLTTAGVGGIVMVTSAVAGLLAENWMNHKTEEERRKVKAELNGLITRTCVAYAADISVKLKLWYDDVIESLKEYQSEWQQSRLEALQFANTKARGGMAVDWKDILNHSETLLQIITT